MWLANRSRREVAQESGAELGIVTVADNPAGVYLAGERRAVPVLSPGGYHWKPKRGDSVLVLKSGAEQEHCLVAAGKEPRKSLRPGEIWISANGEAGILLSGDSIQLWGRIFANGAPISAPPKEEEEP